MGDATLPLGVSADHLAAVLALPPLLALGLALALLGRGAAPVVARVTAAWCAACGGIHLAILPAHAGEPATAALFLANGLAFALVAALALAGRPWRLPCAALCLATVAAYVGYLITGKEMPDTVGVVASAAEMALAAWALTAGRTGWRWTRTIP